MQIAELIEKLNYRNGQYPKEFIDYILANKEEFTPLLMEVLRYSAKEADKYAADKNYLAHFAALGILAFFREKSAFNDIIAFLGITPDNIDNYLGDFTMSSLDSIIASVYNGDLKALENFILDGTRFELCRGEALSSLVILFYKNAISRDELLAVLSRIFDGLDKKEDEITNTVLDVCRRAHLQELMPKVEALYHDEDFLDLWIDDYEELINELKNTDTDYRNKDFISDVEKEIAVYYTPESTEDDDNDFDNLDFDDLDFDDELIDEVEMFEKIPQVFHPDTYVREYPKVGRNDPCLCGSGKKYKKCCGK